VEARLRPLLEEGLIATCAIIDLEVLYSSRRLADYEAVLLERKSLDSAPITPEVLDLAIDSNTSWPSEDSTGWPSRTSSSRQPPGRPDSLSFTTIPTSNESGQSAVPNRSGRPRGSL